MGILRLSHVEIRVPDLELATAYYSEVVGLVETTREAERVFLKCWDEHQHHSVVLTIRTDVRARRDGVQAAGPRRPRSLPAAARGRRHRRQAVCGR